MDRRTSPRFEVNAPVVVTELGGPRKRPIGGMIGDLSDAGMRIKLPCAIPRNTPVRIDTGDMLLLGEVVRCDRDGQGFRIGLAIRHSLSDLSELERLNRALMSFGMPPPRYAQREAQPVGVPSGETKPRE